MSATPQRLRRVQAIIADQRGPEAFALAMAEVAKAPPESKQAYLDALCDAWLGPVQRRWPRSDKGFWRGPREWTYRDMRCLMCGREVECSRTDARWCSNACRQRAYRQRVGE